MFNIDFKKINKKKKRVGRGIGSKRGITSTRGYGGYGARSGSKGNKYVFEGGQMPISRRLPRFGFTNARNKEKKPIFVSLKRIIEYVNIYWSNLFEITDNLFKKYSNNKKYLFNLDTILNLNFSLNKIEKNVNSIDNKNKDFIYIPRWVCQALAEKVTPVFIERSFLIKNIKNKVKVIGSYDLNLMPNIPICITADSFSKTAEEIILLSGGKCLYCAGNICTTF